MPQRGKGNGYWGKILKVDLGTKETRYEELEDAIYREYLGGVGLGAKILWEEMVVGEDPLGPGNILGFTPGLLTDTGALFSGRFLVVGKSPQTGGWGDANCGGFFSPALKRCGIDGLFVTGASKDPVYLHIGDQGARLEDASGLWGLDALEAEAHLKTVHGEKARVAAIGQAGERLSWMAGIVHDRGRIAARSGLGAVMGSKNLKAVVAAGTRKIGTADREKMIRLSRDFNKRLQGMQGFKKFLGDRLLGMTGWITRKSSFYPRQPADLWRLMLAKFGTPSLTALSAESGDSPIKNWGGIGYLDFPLKRSKKIGPEAVIRYEVKKYGCHSCPLHCGGIFKIPDGPYPIEEMHKPEYETLCAFGGLMLHDDLYIIFRINDLLNRAGMDTISCGGAAAFAIECFENGILTPKDTDGLELRWGNSEAILKLVEKIINREGVGDLLADGVKRAAQKIGRGSERFAVHCGGVEAPMHDPKFDPGFAVAYACEPTPGRHTIASYQYLDLQYLEKKFSRARKIPAITTHKERYDYRDRGEALAVDSFYKMLIDCAGICLFGTQIRGNIPIGEWINAASGFDLSNDQYLALGERVEQVRHAFNLREGLNPIKDFKLHPRIYGDPPLAKGPAKDITLDLETLIRSFYQALHWDPETGIPERNHLESLNLQELIKVFYPD
jgi:aldehyde:ferredoxin oxidoreductase